jgi:hypothetical protein
MAGQRVEPEFGDAALAGGDLVGRGFRAGAEATTSGVAPNCSGEAPTATAVVERRQGGEAIVEDLQPAVRRRRASPATWSSVLRRIS